MAAEVVECPGDARPGSLPHAARLHLGDRFVSTRVASALSVPVGPQLIRNTLALVTGSAEPEGRLSPREWVEVNVAVQAGIGFLQALQLTAVRELDRAMDPVLADPEAQRSAAPSTRAALELAPALGMAPRSATSLVALARRCEEDLPGTVDALADGAMTRAQVTVVEQVTRVLPPRITSAVESLAVRVAPATTTAQLRARIEADAARLDPGGTARAAAEGVARRDVSLTASPLPGCRRLLLDLPHLAAVGAWHALNGAAVAARAHGGPDGAPEDRSLAQLRADLATSLLTGQQICDVDPAGDVPDVTVPSGAALTRYAEVHVVVSADDLTADDLTAEVDAPAEATDPDFREAVTRAGGTARIPGSGPLDLATTQELARTAPLRRLVADPTTGGLRHRGTRTVHVGSEPLRDAIDRLAEEPVTAPEELTTTAYRPGAPLRRFVVSRDQTCLGPACHHPAWRTQLDHTVNHGETAPDGTTGTTSHDNLGSVCQPLHNAKTHDGWHLHRPHPCTFTWTSPTGRTYPVESPRLLDGRDSQRPAVPP